jgi:hypothetical protein
LYANLCQGKYTSQSGLDQATYKDTCNRVEILEK